MNKTAIIEFFDRLSKDWDKNQIVEKTKIEKILDVANVKENSSVLDIACGTGVMVPFYLERNVSSVLGVDISGEMISIAEEKFKNFDNVSFIRGDADSISFENKFDCCMIYNAFPHFINPDMLIKNLTDSIKTGGTLTVAHGMGKKTIDSHHSNVASEVSCGLIHQDELELIFLQSGYHNITKIATEEIYIVSGAKK